MITPPRKVRVAVLYIAAATLLFGMGSGTALAFFWADNPSIIVETKWKTITTAPPVTYQAETPFHMDENVCASYVPPTTSTTSARQTPVPVTVPPTTAPPQPPSTLPPSSTTLPSETTATTAASQ